MISPHGPAALSPASGLNGCISVATALIHTGTGVVRSESGGLSGNPQGSTSTTW